MASTDSVDKLSVMMMWGRHATGLRLELTFPQAETEVETPTSLTLIDLEWITEPDVKSQEGDIPKTRRERQLKDMLQRQKK